MESGVIYLCSCRITQRLWDFASSVLQMNGFEAITCKQLQLSCLYLTCWIISHSARGGEKVVEVVVGTCRTSIWLKNIYCSVFGTILWICGVSLHDCNKLFQSDFFSFSFGKFVSETFWTWLTWKRLCNISPHLGMTWVSQREKKEDLNWLPQMTYISDFWISQAFYCWQMYSVSTAHGLCNRTLNELQLERAAYTAFLLPQAEFNEL